MPMETTHNDVQEQKKQLRKRISALLKTLPGRIWNATARGTDYDCVSRSFTPEIAVPEDPVCGSAHCQIADYWAETLGRQTIRAYQASARGGELLCTRTDDRRMRISGKAVLVAVSEIVAKL